LGHADRYALGLQYPDIVRAAVLDAPVRMVDQVVMGIHPVFDGHPQGTDAGLRRGPVGEPIADDLPGVGIRDQAQVDPSMPDAHIGDIAHPDLFGPVGMPALDQVWPFLEAVPGLRGNHIAFPGLHQKIVLPHQGKEGIPSQAQHGFAHLAEQDAPKFDTAHPVGVLADLAHALQYQAAPNLRLLVPGRLFIEGLPFFAK